MRVNPLDSTQRNRFVTIGVMVDPFKKSAVKFLVAPTLGALDRHGAPATNVAARPAWVS